jgi:hypothetical protein
LTPCERNKKAETLRIWNFSGPPGTLPHQQICP